MANKVDKFLEIKDMITKGVTINIIINVIIALVLIVGIYLMFAYDMQNRKHVIGMSIVTIISIYYAIIVLSLSFGFSYLGYKLEQKTDIIRDSIDSNTFKMFNLFGKYKSTISTPLQ